MENPYPRHPANRGTMRYLPREICWFTSLQSAARMFDMRS